MSNEFDYTSYEKSLEKILAMAEKDYWAQYIDVNRHQVNVAKTYLWVAAALLGSYVAFYEQYKETIWSTNHCTTIVMILSIISGVFAFGLCIYAIPARKGYKSIADPSWGEFSKKSYDLLKGKKENSYSCILTDIVNRVDSSTSYNVATNQKRAKLLRFTSWVLIASFGLALLSGASIAISKLEISITPTKKETIMTTEESKPTAPSETPAAPTAETPNVPEPAGPIGSGTENPNYTTHSVTDIPKGNVRITEGNEEGSSGD